MKRDLRESKNLSISPEARKAGELYQQVIEAKIEIARLRLMLRA